MKKSILIFGAVFTIICLTAFGLINRNLSATDHLATTGTEEVSADMKALEKKNSRIFTDFIYDVGPRFGAIKKGDLDKITSFSEFIEKNNAQRIMTYKFVEVIIIENDKETDIRESGNSNVLTAAQLKLLQSSDYSTNLKIRADVEQKNRDTGELEHSYWTPHLTIVPEKQAEYVSGKDALKTYLKENSMESRVNVDVNKLQPAKLSFTVTNKGVIENVRLDRTSNYPVVDEIMIELINNAPGKWLPAENSKGEKVDQELVVSFGLMGC